MNDLLSQIHPLTRGIIWLCQDPKVSKSSTYKDVDYLLNGLMTAKLAENSFSGSQVFVSENFGEPFFVMITSEINSADMRSFLALLAPQLSGEKEMVVIDELDLFTKMVNIAPKEINAKFRPLK
jgi:hypothetical protein